MQDDALGDLLQPRHHPQRRCLAAPGRADEHDELAVLDRKRQVDDRARPVRVGLADVLEAQTCHYGLNSRIAGSNRSLKSKSAWFSHALPEAGSRGLQPLPGTPVQVASQ